MVADIFERTASSIHAALCYRHFGNFEINCCFTMLFGALLAST